MKFVFTLFFCLTISFVQAQEDHSDMLDAMIKEGMTDWQIPGLSAIVVKDGEVVFHKSYGVKNLDSNEAVDDNTLFTMASTTKAVIAIALGMLVDEGKLKWEDKVITHYPEFRLSDPYITADARVQDLLTHNLGMGNADMLWILDSVSTSETIRRFQYAKPAYPLRAGYTYQNIMWAIAGEVVGAASGMDWREYVHSKILEPLEMGRTQTSVSDIMSVGNYVTPYYDDFDEGIVEVGYTMADQIGAAGMMWTSTADIANYLTFLIDGGVYKGDTLLKPHTFAKLFTPQALIPEAYFYPTHNLTDPDWMSYGLGWFQHDYRGSKLDFHTGSLWGLVAIAGIMHEHNTAVYVMANLDHAELRHAIMYKALDLYAYDDDSRDWHEETYALYDGMRSKAEEGIENARKKRIQGTSPTLPLNDYAGTYHNEMWGSITVSLNNNTLEANINDHLHFTLEHWQYDSFKTNKEPNLRFALDINFNLSTDHQSVKSIGSDDYVYQKIK